MMIKYSKVVLQGFIVHEILDLIKQAEITHLSTDLVCLFGEEE